MMNLEKMKQKKRTITKSRVKKSLLAATTFLCLTTPLLQTQTAYAAKNTTPAITIEKPDGWKQGETTIAVTVDASHMPEGFSIAKIEAKAGKDGSWQDVTGSGSITITGNQTVYVRVTDGEGKVYEQNRSIKCYDTEKPTLSASLTDGVLTIQGNDTVSGITAVTVNGTTYTDLKDGMLRVQLTQKDFTTKQIEITVTDGAGNTSEKYVLQNPYYEWAKKQAEKQKTSNDSNGAMATTTSADTTGTEKTTTSPLPQDAQASEPTDAKGTVDDRTVTGIEWLWYPFIPYGKLTIIQGDPGDGKTTMVLNLAAKLSKGEALDENMKVTEPVNVIYQTAEDGLADTVKPRLELAGADCERIIVIDESDKSLSMVDERLEEAIVRTGARLLILDPIQAYLGGGMDMNRANEARDMTKKLGALAEKSKCAIILIGHMNKASGNKAAYRGMGSIDFFAVARSVLLVGRVEGEPNTRAVVQIKNNLAAFGHPKAFALSEEGFQWIGDYEITVAEVLGGIAPKANKMELAKQMLRELAETHSAVLSNEIFDRADELGISKRTLENAKKELGIRARKINNAWYWELDKVKQE